MLFKEIINCPVNYHSTDMKLVMYRATYSMINMTKPPRIRERYIEREPEGLARVSTGVKTRQKLHRSLNCISDSQTKNMLITST